MRVRVSIANLAWYVVNSAAGERRMFGIFNPAKLKENKRQIMALGGGAMLSENGKEVLERMFGASDFEKDEKTGYFDARFRAEEKSVERIFLTLWSPRAEYERDPTLDIWAELTGKEFPGYPTLLTPQEAEKIKFIYNRTVRQGLVEAGKDTSSKAVDVPTHRLFRIYDILMPPGLFEKFTGLPHVRVLTQDELFSTTGGRTAGKTNDGLVIQNNLFL